MFEHHHFLSLGDGNRLNLPKRRSFWLPPVEEHLISATSTRCRSPGTRGTPSSPFSQAEHRARGPARGLPGRGEAQAAPAGPKPAAQVRAPKFAPSPRLAAARTPRVRSGTSLLAPPSRPRLQRAPRPAALRPQTPEWLREPAERPGSSDPPRALRSCPVASRRTSLRFVCLPESFS